MKEQIQILIDGKEIEYYELEEHFKNLDCITKEDGKWFIHKKPIEDEKIEKLNNKHFFNKQRQLANKINEIIEVINEKNQNSKR